MSADSGFARLATRLETKALRIARRRAAARIAQRRRDGSHWRAAPYLWPLFGA